jgi:hypothetical protein
MKFYYEKGNWHIDETTWANYGIFCEGKNKAFAMTQSVTMAEQLVNLLNEAYANGGWDDEDDKMILE